MLLDFQGMQKSFKFTALYKYLHFRSNYPVGRFCSASRMVARNELETIMKRYRDSDNNKKMSTPSGLKESMFSLKICSRKLQLDILFQVIEEDK